MTGAEKLASVRAALGSAGVDAFLLPMTDEYQGEYLAEDAKRLEWLTGFTGSAGWVVVLAGVGGMRAQEREPAMSPQSGAPMQMQEAFSGYNMKSAFFTDGRYTLQAAAEVDAALYDRYNISALSPTAWLAANLPAGAVVAYDPWLMTWLQVENATTQLIPKNITLRAVTPNPVDALWANRPAPPMAPVVVHGVEYSGEEAAAKIARMGAALQDAREDAAVLTACDSVMWLLNIRGGDVPMTPFAHARAVLHADGRVWLFVAPEKISAEVRRFLGDKIEIIAPQHFISQLQQLRGKAVRIDPQFCPAAVAQALQQAGATVTCGADPCQLPKACKNAVEIVGTRAAHMRDGLALTRFLAWVEEETRGEGRGAILTEFDIMERLESFRAMDARYCGPSFTTIAGSGPNGAIVHYRATLETARALDQDNLLLVDSGGQYKDGTTDVTRTIALGAPPRAMREDFTRVLKGHIAMARAVFPVGTTGSALDALARQFLWQAGQDYDHGTGHGVGSYLSVHEGPQRISKRGGDTALQAGMILSNEPGYYAAGSHGIRIENLVVVTPHAREGFLCFETLTLAPIDVRCVVVEWLDAAEKEWLNAYHARVFAAHAGQLEAAEREWLAGVCRDV